MEQHSERPDPRSDQEPQIQELGDAGEAPAGGWAGAVVAAADAEAEPDRVAFGAGEHADADNRSSAGEHADADERPGAGEHADVEEDTGAVAWDVEDDADAEWDAQEDVDAVVSDAQDPDAIGWDVEDVVAWDTGETAGGAVPVPDEPEQRPATGEPRVDAALARLDELAGRPVPEHRAIFEDVHRRLRDVLGELDTREQNSGDQPAGAGAEHRASR